MSSALAAPSSSSLPTPEKSEENLRRELSVRVQRLKRREPLDASYRHFIMNSNKTPPPNLNRDPLYKKIGAELRECVEKYMSAGGEAANTKIGQKREDLDEIAMRAAFTLRECKKHEQEGFLNAPTGADEARKKKMESMALGLQVRPKKKKPIVVQRKVGDKQPVKVQATAASTKSSIAEKVRKKEEEFRRKVEDSRRKQEVRDRELEELERKRVIERAKDRERQREVTRREDEDRDRDSAEKAREEASKKARMAETPHQALHRLYEPIFQVLWDLEFSYLHGTNPFRIVIDKDNCAAMGVPDYCAVVKQPMNLTYIRDKVDHKKYETLQAFFADVELMISNALLYNSDPNNEFHLAAKEMKKKYKKMAKRVVQSLQHQKAAEG